MSGAPWKIKKHAETCFFFFGKELRVSKRLKEILLDSIQHGSDRFFPFDESRDIMKEKSGL
jgi:hypothetical protein